MKAGTALRRHGARAGLLLAVFLGGGTSIGMQDITGRLAHQPGVAERVRISVLSGSLHTLKAATFAWPSSSSLLSNSVIPEPPAAALLAIGVNRDGKTDRLAAEPPDTLDGDPLVAAGHATLPSIAGAGAGTGASVMAGTGTGAGEAAGVNTDPAEADDAVAATAGEAPGAAAQSEGAYSLSAGDPTGDPTQLETAGPAIALATDSTELAPEDEMAALDDHQDASLPLYRQAAFIFGYDRSALPPQPFLHEGPSAPDGGTTTTAKTDAAADAVARVAQGPSPAERLGLSGKRRERSENCLAEAVYFESRGEPVRGQVAVAQVVMNRVFSGYYPADVCRAVYQNAKRKLACQFTFACDNIPDVVNEPRLWDQAKQIAADMLDGLLWDEKVGRATHYHARSVRPNWIREMRKLDRIGEHTFYRPRRWTS